MPRQKAYHHGNLREVLLDAAIRLISEVGPAGFTLREVARRAGVSHNAPYRHFRDKDELMAAVATQGFQELTQVMLRAAGGAPRGAPRVVPSDAPTARDRLKRAGVAYVTFALRRPEHFAVMFDGPASVRTNHPDSSQAADQAFGTLLNLVKNCLRKGQLPPGDPNQFALLAWTMVHGIAKLAITAHLPFRSKAAILRFAEFVIDQSLPKAP